MQPGNSERNLEVVYTFPIPRYLTELLIDKAQEEEEKELVREMFIVGLRIAVGIQKGYKYYFHDGEKLTRAKIGPLGNQLLDEDGVPFFNHDEFLRPFLQKVINPAQDRGSLINDFKFSDGAPIQLSSQSIQDQAKDLVAQASEKVRTLFPDNIPTEYQIKLERAKNGVVVVRDLSQLKGDELQVPKILSTLFDVSFIVHTDGAVIKPFDVILLSERIFTNKKVGTAKRLETATHETLHLISDNDLPEALNEGATDTYAERATGVDLDAHNRASGNIRLGYDLWNYIEKQVGEVAAWQVYLEPPSYRIVRDKDTHAELNRSYAGAELHDRMREILDRQPVGESRWDKALELMHVGNMLRATDLIYPLGLRLRTRVSYLSPYFKL